VGSPRTRFRPDSPSFCRQEICYQSLNLQVLNTPFITGVAVQINWRDIESTQGAPNWSTLDELFAAADSANKWIQLAIFPAFISPARGLEGAQTERNFAGSRVL
jgi:hypothetical protein